MLSITLQLVKLQKALKNESRIGQNQHLPALPVLHILRAKKIFLRPFSPIK